MREDAREAARPPTDDVRCAFCHEPDPDQDCETCPRCASVLHVECWAESRRCPTLGCGFVAGDVGALAGEVEDVVPATERPHARVISRSGVVLSLALIALVLFLVLSVHAWPRVEYVSVPGLR